MLEYAILGLISLQPLTGYEIKKIFENTPNLPWAGNNNQIYTTLVELHRRGWLEREVHAQEDHPARKIYSITVAGQAALLSWVGTEPELPQQRHAFLIQLVWAGGLPAGALDALLARYEEEVLMQLRTLTAQPDPAYRPERPGYIQAGKARSVREQILWRAVTANWLHVYEYELEWVRGLRNELNAAGPCEAAE